MSTVPHRRIAIFGVTGSVGSTTVDLIETLAPHAREAITVTAVTGQNNVAKLAAQARRLRAQSAVIGDPAKLSDLREALRGTSIHAAAGEGALTEAASMPVDWVMAAIVGAAGLKPTLAAIRQGATVALANKECLVTAGRLFMDEAVKAGARVIPVDSEHSAIFQTLERDNIHAIERVTLTASGGPFRTWTAAEMARATISQACAHPNWSMGAKISVDSATLMNKGLELIEAQLLFDLEPERVEAVIHPQSIVHGLVSYHDGSVLAHLSHPDMTVPIALALGYPARMATRTRRLDLAALGTLTFEAPDLARFPCLGLAQACLREQGSAPTILNAANEVAVEAFLAGKLHFLGIADTVRQTLDRLVPSAAGQRGAATLDAVLALDSEARAIAGEEASRAATRH